MLFNILFKLSRKSGVINFIFKRLYSCDIPRKVNFCGSYNSVSFPPNALGVVIHPNAKIGKNVCIQHHVLLGQKKTNIDAPIIKDNVIINPYSIIIGKVIIGENSIIGAGSIVTKDVPANSIYYNKVIPFIKTNLKSDK